eukprot:534747-Pleurochrysis_carterae.AAC.2
MAVAIYIAIYTCRKSVSVAARGKFGVSSAACMPIYLEEYHQATYYLIASVRYISSVHPLASFYVMPEALQYWDMPQALQSETLDEKDIDPV